jgi:hypothetical protein
MSSVMKEKSKIFEMILSSPGMQDQSKITLKLSRQSILLLARLIESGLDTSKGTADELVAMVSPESKQELDGVVPELLKKSGLEQFYEKVKAI